MLLGKPTNFLIVSIFKSHFRAINSHLGLYLSITRGYEYYDAEQIVSSIADYGGELPQHCSVKLGAINDTC